MDIGTITEAFHNMTDNFSLKALIGLSDVVRCSLQLS